LAHTHQSIAWWFARAGRVSEALAEYRLAEQIFDRLAHDHPTVSTFVAAQGQVLGDVGDQLRALGRLDEALDTMKRAQEVLDRVARENPNVLQYQYRKASAEIYTASLLNAMGRRLEAHTAYEHALLSNEQLLRKDGLVHYNIACAHACLASLISTEPGPPTPSRRDRASQHLDQAMTALHQAVESGYRNLRNISSDPDLALLRSRADFRQLMMDLAFPADAFAL
jgi:tetratricopeptide (TPR) repeat protein